MQQIQHERSNPCAYCTGAVTPAGNAPASGCARRATAGVRTVLGDDEGSAPADQTPVGRGDRLHRRGQRFAARGAGLWVMVHVGSGSATRQSVSPGGFLTAGLLADNSRRLLTSGAFSRRSTGVCAVAAIQPKTALQLGNARSCASSSAISSSSRTG